MIELIQTIKNYKHIKKTKIIDFKNSKTQQNFKMKIKHKNDSKVDQLGSRDT